VTPDEYLEQTKEQGVRELEEFLRIPSISSQPEHKQDVLLAAEHLKQRLQSIGLENTAILPTAGHPVVYADWLHAPGKPTALVYGHYDVQPVDPIELWTSPPFEPARKDGQLLARGSSDDKGQLAVHWQGIDALLRTRKALPLNLKVIAEGEEEIGSPNFAAFVEGERERLRTDCVVVSDTSMVRKGLPAITYALRGLIYMELKVEAASSDLHSGGYGGLAPNPIQALAEILTGLKDSSGRVTVPGFYDRVRPLTEEERRQFERVPVDERQMTQDCGIAELTGEPGFTPRERQWARPTLDANGVWGGYQGPGAKTIIPAWAAAKLSCRLVPDQEPSQIFEAVRRQVEAVRPRTVRTSLELLSGQGEPFLMPMEHPLNQAARRALRRVYAAEPAFTRSGGSIGAVLPLHRMLGAPCLLVGFVLPDSRAHAPNETLDLDCFHLGRRAAAALWEEIAAITPSS
jgi:acetylornithine deacetylase/succinyl-diaminopimelate desuccinylase-like protein